MTSIERRLLARLASAGAITAARAHPLPTLARAPDGWLARLEATGLLHEASQGRYYLDIGNYAAYRRRRARRLAVLALGIALGIALAAAGAAALGALGQ